jgi:hypothetical protein
LEHLRRWREQGGTLKAYATANGLSVSALYAAKSSYERTSTKPASGSLTQTTLLPVRVATQRRQESIRISLPNGVLLEVPSGLSADEWAPLMMLVAASR